MAKNQATIEELQKLRNELETKVSNLQVELSEKQFSVDFESTANLTRVMKHLNDDVAWSTKNAALLVNLSDSLKAEKQRINIEVTLAKQEKRELEKGVDSNVNLKAIDLNTLYQSLLGVQSSGIESARNYIRLLTNIGSQISDAMRQMAEDNKQVQALHAELGDLDKRITEFGIPAETESNSVPAEQELANETSK
jgi:hypothetical protein